MIQDDLIFDVGFHVGEDTDFYLRKGYRVVAVEANPALAAAGADKFRPHIDAGRLTIVNLAISDQRGVVDFYVNQDRSIWGTLHPEWAERNALLGAKSEVIKVTAAPLSDLLQEFGVPYYMKVDIEGADVAALKGLSASEHRPQYVSIESSKDSFRALRHEFHIFQALGYDRFKIVPQRWINRDQRALVASEHGPKVYRFQEGASGQFGDDAPGVWITAEQAIKHYKNIFLRYALTGDDPLLDSRLLINLLKAFGLRGQWYDTHAELSSANR